MCFTPLFSAGPEVRMSPDGRFGGKSVQLTTNHGLRTTDYGKHVALPAAEVLR